MDPELELNTSEHAPLLWRLCRYLSDQSPQPTVAVEGLTHVVIYVNPAFARFVGREQTDLVGRPFAEAVPEGHENGCLTLLDRVFRTGIHEHLAEQEHRHTLPRPVYWSYAMWAIQGADDRPVGVMIQVTDSTETATFREQVTAVNEALLVSSVRQHELIEAIERSEHERRALEAHLFQVQKMESLGVLAGGIAHDLNNMLTPVLGFTDLAKSSIPADSQVRVMLDLVTESALRAADLVRQILAYAGKGQFVIQPLNLSSLVREMSELLEAVVAVNTKLKYELDPDLPPSEADTTQIRQVVVNLVTNASEALEQRGGTVIIRTGTVVDVAPPSVFLEVTDSGCGMSQEVVQKIFDPFFTTKFAGRGLGLAMVHSIASGHGGALHVRSEPGQGSTFRLVLPCTTKAVSVRSTPDNESSWKGTGAVLVIDDEPGVRHTAASVLKQASLTVLVAGDGLEGIEIFQKPKQTIDAVVMDMTMPHMSGIEAAGVLRRIRPDLPIVLMSGYSAQEAHLKFADLGITDFVQKPFKTADLLTAVRNALGQ
jgi:two-component system cell cycle sensor histidine kinase/response regulator CckA